MPVGQEEMSTHLSIVKATLYVLFLLLLEALVLSVWQSSEPFSNQTVLTFSKQMPLKYPTDKIGHSYTIAEPKKRMETKEKSSTFFFFFFFSVGTNEEVNFERLNGFAFVSTNDAPFHNAPGNDGKRRKNERKAKSERGLKCRN